ncbi:type II secretion system GspH family protein (plasmid) [Deinococcus sp. KNUC1210]|uniref:type IV pilus modification PilV family protein n=1 Tax=Deinococcus sp. KNUC1210 TaxID=2917691 RepID=UPI001EF01B61|nr:type II secretion system protein [Deinococcus sp. KNUC1210]ULH17705.1 type II secretion system GspH family protein [Deinococcus sp. KNUC1210]
MKTKVQAYQAGFTLIEVLVSVALLGLLIVMVSYFATSLSSSTKAKSLTVAQTFARSYLDVLRTKWSVPGQYRTTSLPDPTTNEVKPSTGFSYVTQVVNAANTTILSYTYPNATSAAPTTVADASTLKRVLLSVRTPEGQTFLFASQFVNPPQ